MKEKTTQSGKARLGAIGESHVVAKLMEKGWDAFNANCTIKNFKSIDIVCIDGDSTDPKTPWKPNIALVQVKTCIQSNIPTNTNIPIGFTIAQCLNKDYLEKNVMGAYVFVSAKKEDDKYYDFKYFILSRRMFIELAYAAHKYYVEEYTRKIIPGVNDTPDYINGVKITSPAGLYLRWINGESDDAAKNRGEFKNPLSGQDCEDWKNIWKD